MSADNEPLPDAVVSKDGLIQKVNNLYWQEVAYRTALEAVVETLKMETRKCVPAIPSS
jgi:hypothetical protein